MATIGIFGAGWVGLVTGGSFADLGHDVVVRDIQPEPGPFFIYVGSVCLYAVLYSVIALLFGLVLFGDRDLA